ncbi:MAG: tRNA (adenosine(37)-N6)-threonylcarbamoyltransferase complex dimerization subunit type 1 TsaB [Chthoniobacteraceae bacterium]
MITLAIETSTPEGSVAVYAGGEIAFHDAFSADRSHSSALFVALEKARGYAGRFDRVVVGLGPGSYAGVRIGIAAAIGMNLVLNAELVGIPSVAAFDVKEEDYFAIGDARRGAYYFTWLHRRVAQEGPRLATEGEIRAEIGARSLPVYSTEPVPAFPSVQIVRPSATILAELAVEGSAIIQSGELEPLYLREPHITQPKPR